MVALLAAIAGLGSLQATAALAEPTEVGYRDYYFGNANSPTGEKPQSKLWFNDGSWWGVLWDPATQDWHIQRFDWDNHRWIDTGTLAERRSNSKPDALWDGDKLYVAAAPDRAVPGQDQSAYIRRYSYDANSKSYAPDPGFPATVASGPMEAIVLDKDTTGKLWVTYTQNNSVYVNRSLGDQATWGTPFVLPVEGTSVAPDDISSVIAFGSEVGVMWSNQTDGNFYFATHTDGDPDEAWDRSRVVYGGPQIADDHINLKADSSGRVYAAVKTSLASSADDPLILLLVRERDGSWTTSHVFGRVIEDHTRAMVLVDEEHRELYVFATAPISPGGVIYHKKTSMDDPSFEGGWVLPS